MVRVPVVGRLMSGRNRNLAIDALRGLVMVLMALDHARDFFADGFAHSATNLATTTPVLFFTRWITHFCAPVFIFLAGTSSYLYLEKKGSRDTARFLLTRGLWMVFLELTFMRLGWTPDPLYRITMLQVIWAIGWSMVGLSALVAINRPWLILVAGLLLTCAHNALEFVKPESFGSMAWLWKILHEGGALEPFRGKRFYVAYPVLPWVGVIALGHSFGSIFRKPLAERTRMMMRLGLGLVPLFCLLRASNVYGDPKPWAMQARGAIYTGLSFINCHKYPPSLLYLCMTLGPALCVLALFEKHSESKVLKPLAMLGSVPLFYYFAHIVMMRWSGLAISYARYGMHFIDPPPGHTGLGLWAAYVGWIVVLAILYPLCRWFAGVKSRRREWWMSYL